MGDWLDMWDILLWERDGRTFVSLNSPEIAIRLSKEGYRLLGDASKLQGWASTALDENYDAVDVGGMK